MTHVGKTGHFFLLLLLGLLAVSMVLTSGAAEARQSGDLSITLSAPAQVRELLTKHFELPTSPLSDETARATFMRRAQPEIGELLATEGYFTATVTLHPAGPNGVQKLEVIPGPRTVVSSLSIEFKGEIATRNDPAHLARIERTRTAWLMKVGAPFRSQDWEEAKAALLASVAREDYAAAQITLSQARVDPDNAHAELSVVIDSGPAFRFGELAVSGLERYEENLVVRQAPFHAGDPYRRNLLLAFQARLQNMPQFSSVTVNIKPDPSTHEAATVNVALTEAKTRRLGLGVGYSTNNGYRSEINYLDHNLFDRTWNLNAGLRLETNRQTLSAGIDMAPDDNGYLLSWGAGLEETLIAGLKTTRTKLGVTRSRTQGQIETRVGINWQEENRRPYGGIQEINQALVMDWQWHRRAIDDPLYPRQGSVTEIRIGGGSRQLLSDHDFLRSYARQQLWWPVARQDVFSLRGEAGFTAAVSRLGIPQEYLFRAGGSQSVRGYAYQSLGVQEGAAVVGGRTLASGSAEYTHWFNRDWGAALFTDVGGAADTWNTLRVYTGYGTGMRWRSPVGPLALDIAWGQQSRALRLHFSLAAVF